MNSLILVILVPLFSAMILALLRGFQRLEKAFCVASCLGLTAFVFWLLAYVDAHGIQATALSGYSAPFGIALVADRLACIMLCLSMAVGSVVVIYTCFSVTDQQQNLFFYPLFQIILAGVNWAFITGDLFNLFVAYEVMLIGSYGLMLVGASKEQVRQSLKYIAINVVGGSFFVIGLGYMYATVGSLNMADIAQRTALMTGQKAHMVTAMSMVLLFVFALKAATFPLIYWLPDSYPVVPAGVSGYFAGLLTKVGVYSLLRVFVMVFRQEGHEFAGQILLVLSGLTMLLGVMGAMCQWDIRKILSWHIISQVGYMVMGIGLASQPAIAAIAVAGTIFYVVHHIIVKSSLFLVGGIAERVTGTQELKKMGGALDLAPGVAGLFLVASFSLAGMPPFSGFVSKFVVIKAGMLGGNYIVVAVAVITGFLTLYSMSKIWSYAFWGPKCRPAPAGRYRGMAAPTSLLILFTIGLGLFAQPCLRLATDAAHDVIDPTNYIQAVLGPDKPQGPRDIKFEQELESGHLGAQHASAATFAPDKEALP
ncbi:MAG: hypothetical protein IT442_09600 [Phycisphaeraceae bacterium]|nr:hypothetical protein [Phycisphaeraceae bacterium]